jgi:hypothetical protein
MFRRRRFALAFAAVTGIRASQDQIPRLCIANLRAAFEATGLVRVIDSFDLAPDLSVLKGPRKYGMALSISYIKASSVAWLASIIGHEGQHHLNAGKYSGANLWKDEQSAGRTGLGIGIKVGFTTSERIYVEQWIDDANRAAMQRHMEQGLKY